MTQEAIAAVEAIMEENCRVTVNEIAAHLDIIIIIIIIYLLQLGCYPVAVVILHVNNT